jgi:hypothetical protein
LILLYELQKYEIVNGVVIFESITEIANNKGAGKMIEHELQSDRQNLHEQ